jgi:hypothetical protein
MLCGGVAVPLRVGEFGERQVGPSHLKARLDCREGVQGCLETCLCF